MPTHRLHWLNRLYSKLLPFFIEDLGFFLNLCEIGHVQSLAKPRKRPDLGLGGKTPEAELRRKDRTDHLAREASLPWLPYSPEAAWAAGASCTQTSLFFSSTWCIWKSADLLCPFSWTQRDRYNKQCLITWKGRCPHTQMNEVNYMSILMKFLHKNIHRKLQYEFKITTENRLFRK